MLNFSRFQFGEIIDITESHDLPQSYFDDGYLVRYFETPEEETAFKKEEAAKKIKPKLKEIEPVEEKAAGGPIPKGTGPTFFGEDGPETIISEEKGTKPTKED